MKIITNNNNVKFQFPAQDEFILLSYHLRVLNKIRIRIARNYTDPKHYREGKPEEIVEILRMIEKRKQV